MLRSLPLLAAVSALTACAASTGSGSRPRIDPVDLTLTRACERPATLPNRDLSEDEVVRLWGSDRTHLLDCANRHKAHVEAIRIRDDLIAGRSPIPTPTGGRP